MPIITHHLTVRMQGHAQIENVSDPIRRCLSQTPLQAGLVTLFVKHTTASVMIFEDEPGLRADTKTFWDRLIPADPAWQHNARNPGEDNGHSHLRGQLQRQSLTIPFADKQLLLGTWQAIGLVDFDTRARSREIVVQIMGE